VLAARALVYALIAAGRIGKDADQHHSGAASWTRGAGQNSWWNVDMRGHVGLNSTNWLSTNATYAPKYCGAMTRTRSAIFLHWKNRLGPLHVRELAFVYDVMRLASR
jgi:hypothetical protein